MSVMFTTNSEQSVDSNPAETYYPRRKDVPKAFLEAIVGETERQVENQRVEQVVSSGNVEQDLRQALEVSD